MGTPWVDHPSYEVVTEISDLTGVDVDALLTTADLEHLVRTDNAQLATFALSSMIADAASPLGASLAIGHSLGEYSALAFAGILERADAARLVVARGHAMLAASSAQAGSMVAVLGADEDTLTRALDGFDGLVIANHNAPGQLVVAGPLDQLETLRANAKDLGLRKVVPLEVGGAFHSPLMAPAQGPLRAALDATEFHHGDLPVIANIDATAYDGDADWRALLAEQLTGSVQFAASIASIDDPDATYIECGPGGVLIGLVKRIAPAATLINLATPDDLESLEGARP
jgi:[acyl-carrier-protein] S-malonyltransferase